MSAQGVFTPEYRFRFVEGEVTTGTPTSGFVACGSGTAFPMEVTLSQLAEILYRVRDANFIAGAATFVVGGVAASISAPVAAPTNRATEDNPSTYQYRGYTKPGTSSYYGVEYDAGNGVMYSDIADNERGIWGPHWAVPPASPLIDAFFYLADDPNDLHASDSEWFNAYGIAGVYAAVVRGDRVAIVRENPADGFFTPTNRFFLELEFYCYDYNPVLAFGGSTNIYGSDGFFGGDPTFTQLVCNYVIRLAPLTEGDPPVEVFCPFYAGTIGADSVTGADFIHAATEWWPYAKNSPPEPVWNAATGAKL